MVLNPGIDQPKRSLASPAAAAASRHVTVGGGIKRDIPRITLIGMFDVATDNVDIEAEAPIAVHRNGISPTNRVGVMNLGNAAGRHLAVVYVRAVGQGAGTPFQMEGPAPVGIVIEMSSATGKARVRQHAQRKSSDCQSDQA